MDGGVVNHFVSQMADSIKVTVKSSAGLKFDVEFSPEITVGELKKILEAPDKAGFGAELQRLIYSGRILKDEQKLSTYNVCSRARSKRVLMKM